VGGAATRGREGTPGAGRDDSNTGGGDDADTEASQDAAHRLGGRVGEGWVSVGWGGWDVWGGAGVEAIRGFQA